ncbi:MAG: hypothetical protein ACREHG_04380, partial [Candidatus Saccharimonadales bacterium]
MNLNIYLSASVRLLFVQFSPAAINLNGYIQSLLANAATLFADDSIVVYDSDTSTGGASTYITDLHIIEMDAY